MPARRSKRDDVPAHISPFLRLSDIDVVEPLAARRGVAKVARGDPEYPSEKRVDEGFMVAYRRAGGHPERLSNYWLHKREEFIARHMAQIRARGEPLYEPDGVPTRRHLALIEWAYSPDWE